MPDDAMTDDQLRHWAEHNQSHSAAARGVLRLLEELVRLRECEKNWQWLKPVPVKITENPVLDAPEEQTNPIFHPAGVFKPFDGSTGTPAHGVAGHKSEGTGS